ncbi:nucleotide cyclase [Haematococcus lacustris]
MNIWVYSTVLLPAPALQVDVTDAVLAEQQVAALQRQQEALLQQILPQQVLEVGLDWSQPPLSGTTGIVQPAGMLDLALGQLPPGQLVITKLLERHTAKAGEQHNTAQEQLAVPDGVTLPAAAGPAASSLDMDAGKESFVSVTGHLMSISPAKPSPAKSAGPPCDTLAAPCQQAPPPASPGGLPQLSGRDVMDLATMHQEVSILFAHIQGFTTMSQRMDPGQTMLLLDHLYSLFDDLLEHHDCYKVETIGDCYMVCAGLFDRSGDTHSCQQGAPNISEAALGADPDQDNRGPHDGSPAPRQLHSPKRRHLHNGGALGGHDPDHAHKLLRFSIAMLRAAQSVTDPWGDPVQMRCGLHCGPVMSGVIGTRMPRFCLFGDTVNTASRMASTGKADVIHVSQAYMSHLPHEAWCETPGVDVKGKGWMQTAFLDPRGRAAAAL